jgi:hypothetical protein
MDALRCMLGLKRLATGWLRYLCINARMGLLGYVLVAATTAVADEKKVPYLRPSASGEDALKEKRQDCGIECLYVFARLNGQPCDLEEIRQRVPLTEEGASARDMQQAAREMGLAVECVRCDPEKIERLALPAIAHIQRRGSPDSSHYVVLTEVTDDSVVFVDPTNNVIHEVARNEWKRASSGYYLAPHAPAFGMSATGLWLGVGGLFFASWLWVRRPTTGERLA